MVYGLGNDGSGSRFFLVIKYNGIVKDDTRSNGGPMW